jgi:hypothetical protein
VRKTTHVKVAALVLLVLSLVLSTAPANAATTENYGQYSMETQATTGQYRDTAGTLSGQWGWTPLSTTASDVAWGNPSPWPPGSAEHFVRSGSWLVLEGYNNGPGTVVTQTQQVTSELIGRADCTGMKPLPSDGGRQHYVQWTIPVLGYCLDASGTISGPNGTDGTEVHFRHQQQWLPAKTCTNRYYHATRSCITQHEKWWDDNSANRVYALRIDRTAQLAKGLGPAFTIRQTFPIVWSADGSRYCVVKLCSSGS